MSNITSFDEKIHFVGDGQFTYLDVFDTQRLLPSHHKPIGITTLNATTGMATSGLDSANSVSKRIEVIGVDGGVKVKGRLKASYSQEDTTAVSGCTKVKLNTTNTTWEQAGEWKLILDIDSGDFTGKFTICMPPFSLMEYSSVYFYITQEGACYFRKSGTGFDVSLAGPAGASENMSNNESAGSSVVIEVADTTGFFDGQEVFVSDSVSSEWARITAIVSNTSITVDTLTNSYTTANGAKLEIVEYIRTPAVNPIQRGLLNTYILKPDINSGVLIYGGIPQSSNTDEDIEVIIQYVSSIDNASALDVKFRLQFLFGEFGEDIPENNQFGELVETTHTPPTTKQNNLHTLATIVPATHGGNHIFSAQIVRMGADSGDTYNGDIRILAIVVVTKNNKLGYEI